MLRFRCEEFVAIFACTLAVVCLSGCSATAYRYSDRSLSVEHLEAVSSKPPSDVPSKPDETCSGSADESDYQWTVTGYWAAGAKEDIGELVLGQVSLDADSVGALAVGYRIGEGRWFEFIGASVPIKYGVEGTLAVRRDTHRDDRYGEAALAFTTRYDDFPWRETVRTFFESGFGVSYAEKIPLLEIRRRDDKTNHLLAFLKLQVGIGIPSTPVDLIGVLHHRSGAWGIFDGASGGSNFLGLGLQVRF